MTALVAVANPAGIDQLVAGPAELADRSHVEQELARARAALGDMNLRVLPGNGRRATRSAIIEELSTGMHVLYLVCHGRIRDGRSQLLLEDDDGDTDLVDGTAFANDVGSLAHIPTIVVLCSCESAGTGAGRSGPPERAAHVGHGASGLAAVGPALASAGATVVVGMQGNVTMTTAGRSCRVLRRAERGRRSRARDGRRATRRPRPSGLVHAGAVLAAQAGQRVVRGAVRRPGGSGCSRNLHTRIDSDKCTPIVGSGIAGEDGVLPSRQELAEQWVTRRQMPIADVSRNDLATVAQFVRVEQEGGADLVRDELQGLAARPS